MTKKKKKNFVKGDIHSALLSPLPLPIHIRPFHL